MLDAIFTDFSISIHSAADLKDIMFVVAGVLGLPFLFWRYYANHLIATAGAAQAKIAEQQHITDRIANSFHLIADDNVHNTLGAIYALERIAWDSPRDQGSIRQYLADYIRRNAPFIPEHSLKDGKKSTDLKDVSSTNARLTRNIDAALNVIGKRAKSEGKKKNIFKKLLFKLTSVFEVIPVNSFRNKDKESKIYGFDLSNTDLSGKNLAGFDLRYADLRNTNLSKSNLAEANLEGADLRRACLNSTNLRMANLERADLKEATCNAAIFIKARLEKANFCDGSLEMAIMIKAELNRAIFINANMKGANLFDADIKGAIFSEAELLGANLIEGYDDKGIFLGAKGV